MFMEQHPTLKDKILKTPDLKTGKGDVKTKNRYTFATKTAAKLPEKHKNRGLFAS